MAAAGNGGGTSRATGFGFNCFSSFSFVRPQPKLPVLYRRGHPRTSAAIATKASSPPFRVAEPKLKPTSNTASKLSSSFSLTWPSFLYRSLRRHSSCPRVLP